MKREKEGEQYQQNLRFWTNNTLKLRESKKCLFQSSRATTERLCNPWSPLATGTDRKSQEANSAEGGSSSIYLNGFVNVGGGAELWVSGSFTADNHWLLKCKPSSARCPTPSCADLPPNLHSHLCLHLTGGQRAGSDNEADGKQTAIQVHREGTQAHPPMHLSAVSAVEHLHDVFEQDDLACFNESPHD